MRLTAQRVVSPIIGRQGINAFCHSHGSRVWLGCPPEDVLRDPGELVDQRIEIPPPGNRVRSYLEIVAPDLAPTRALRFAILDALDLLAKHELPLRLVRDDTLYSFDAEASIAAGWHRELATLLESALAVRLPSHTSPG